MSSWSLEYRFRDGSDDSMEKAMHIVYSVFLVVTASQWLLFSYKINVKEH